MSYGWKQAGAALLACLALSVCAEPLTPPENRRNEEQTFLTFPEWFLVFSPAEYATLLHDRYPSEFPWWGHVGQFWSSYGAVIGATRGYAFNSEYHVMICVIGISTTVEYALRSAYETVIGRVAELFAPPGGTEEDRYAARVAQEYVNFIRVRPWYEFDFAARLAGLWRDVPLDGAGVARKWERRYALTTEYAAMAAYAWLLGLGTQAVYGAESPITVVVLDRAPAALRPGQRTISVLGDGRWIGSVPRYDAFKDHAAALAAADREFREIAGNGDRSPLLLSVVAPTSWVQPSSASVLFAQTLITQPGRRRLALVVPVGELSTTLRLLNAAGVELEHVFDY